MKHSLTNLTDFNPNHKKHYKVSNDNELLDALKLKFGEDFILNKNFLKNYPYGSNEDLSYYIDKNNNIIIENYNRLLYKYKYKIANSIFYETREFVNDIVNYKERKFEKPLNDPFFNYDTNIDNVHFGINKKVEERNYDISDEEFDKVVDMPGTSQNSINNNVIEKVDINEMADTISNEFFESDDLLSLDVKNIESVDNRAIKVKRINIELK